MKKFFSIVVATLFAATVWAQEPAQKPSFKGFVTNGFWDNWELSVGGGVSTALTNGSNIGDRGDRIGYEGNVSLTKWIHPVVGVRGMLQGGKFSNFDPVYGKQKWPYMFAHMDAMLNFSNWVGGYREDRVYYAVPYVGMGYMATNFTSDSQAKNHAGAGQAFAFAYGLLNKFRVCNALDINVELKGLFAPSRVAPCRFNGAYLFGLSATVGVTYRFNRRDWERKPVGTLYSADEIRAYQKAVNDSNAALKAANAEKARLAKDLQAARNEAANARKEAQAAAAAAAATTANEVLDPSTIILYKIGTSTLTPEEKVRLDLKADLIKNGPKDKVYTIEGHADPQTGSAAVNQRISEQRAKGVYDYLVNKGVNPKQLKYEGMGDKHNQYKDPVANRAAIIK